MKFRMLGMAVVAGLISQVSLAANDCAANGGTQSCIPSISNYIYGKWYIRDAHYAYNKGDPNGYQTSEEAKADPRATLWYGIPFFPLNKDEFNYLFSWMSGIDYNSGFREGWYGTDIGQDRLIVHCPLTSPYCITEEKPKCDIKVGNPCSVTNGDKTLNEIDWESLNSPLKVRRTYSSLNGGWSFNDSNTAKVDVGGVTTLYQYISPEQVKAGFIHFIPTWGSPANPSEYPATAIRSVAPYIILTRPDGSRIYPVSSYTDKTIAGDTGWFINRDKGLQINNIGTIWQVKNVQTGTIETYTAQPDPDSPFPASENHNFMLSRVDYQNGQYLIYNNLNGKLQNIVDNLGNQLTYTYDNAGKTSQITLPDGNTINYGYDALGRLSTIQRPGYGIKTYIYDEADKAPNDNPNLLTGIIDENGKRYANYSYDSQNRGILTEHAGGTQKFSLNFGGGATQVTDEYGASRSYEYVRVGGILRVSREYRSNQMTDYRYDQGGNVTSKTKSGNITKYSYDITRNLETSRIDAYGTASSKITLTEWDANKPLKTKITEGKADSNGNLIQALRITNYTYDDKSNALTKTITDPVLNQSRTWTYTYNANSQKLTETNPQGQVTKWEYNDKGFLTKSIDAQGLVTTYSDLNADGKPQTITSPIGQVTTLTYDDAGRVLTQTVTITTPTLADISANQGILSTISNAIASIFSNNGNPAVKYDISKQATQTATTSYQYDGVGQLIKTTLPDGQTISYTYDDAHRMTGMTDSLGNTISYTLNSAGDITQTDNKDASGTLAQTSKQTFDTLGRLANQTGNNGQSQNYGYDNQDNLTNTNDALSRTTSSQYDSLKRKIKDIDANGRLVAYTYNALDQLLTVTDSNNATTSYTYNAFGDVLTTNSPDTGTSTNSYNDKGQLTAQTDGAGRVQNYAYDDKGRLIKRTDSTGKVLASYQYDDKGRISLLTDISGTTAYQYNSNNQVIEKKQTTDGKVLLTRYHYTAGGQLDEALLPSGQLVQYQYTQGILKGVLVKTSDGNSTQVIDNISYSPNGIKGYNWSQTQQAVSYQYDLDGRLTAISDPALQRQYQYDAGNRITNLADSKANLNALFTHDKLDRLTSQNFNQGKDRYSYAYDANGNRTFDDHYSTNSGMANMIMYASGTNRISSYMYDGSGKTINDGTRSYTYNSEGRIERIQAGAVGVVNVYNALGQRVQKNSGTAKTYFSYGKEGVLNGEYDTNGNIINEFIYLNKLPVALISSSYPNEVFDVHTDNQGTPRVITNYKKEILWKWEGDSFGNVKPQIELIKQPLRMAGQYSDDETGLFYNYYRFYNPETGRYLTPDPLGLFDSLNRYNYVKQNPLKYIDFYGLCSCEFLSKSYTPDTVDVEDYYFMPQTKGMICNYNCTSDTGTKFPIAYTGYYYKGWFGDAGEAFKCPYLRNVEKMMFDSRGLPLETKDVENISFDPRKSTIPYIKEQGELNCGEECKP